MVEELRARTGEQGLSEYLVVDSSGKCYSRFPPRLAPSIICFLAPSLPITPIYSPTLLYRATFLRTVVSCLNTEGAKNNKQPKKSFRQALFRTRYCTSQSPAIYGEFR